jgi:RNA polymerase sigma factor (sigma-70 family)
VRHIESDREIYLASCEGDRDAVRTIVERYNGDLLIVARAMGLRDHDAVDVVQFVWMRFFEHLQAVQVGRQSRLRNPEVVRYWLLTTCRNAVRDVYRRRSRSNELAQMKTAEDQTLGRLVSAQDPDRDLIDGERRLALREALGRLDQSDRELLALLMLDPPPSYEDIAEQLGRPVGSIGPTRARCLERLRVILKGVGHE